MGYNITQKILLEHLVEGELKPGEEIAIKIDQTLTQDATGTMVYLQLEAMGISKVKTKKSVAYVDHNTLQVGFENADDHKFIATAAKKYGVYYSKAGNGICHQVHLERFAVPGQTLLGSDSHTPTAGGLGCLAIGAGGLDVAAAMAGYPYYLKMPRIVNVELRGKLKPWVTAKDVIFELLRRLTVKGGVGKIFEYTGEGVKTLSIPERATIANMGAELGATTSIFPSDDVTYEFLKAQGREKDFVRIEPDEDAQYDEKIVIDLSKLEPLVAMPHSPDNVHPISEVKGIKVDQVIIGSCTNSSFKDMALVAKILKGKTIHPDVSFAVVPGSRQVLMMMIQTGILSDIVSAGARILECACGPCIGMGQAPGSGAISVRTFNRNFKGRCGTPDAQVILASPAVAAITAVNGVLSDPRELGEMPEIAEPKQYYINDNMIIPPATDEKVEVFYGPNIKPIPVANKIGESIQGQVLIKVSDNISTDDIIPGTAKLLPLRSNIPALSEYCFVNIDKDFVKRAKAAGGGIIVAGENYGQGSSREHAALVPLYLGIKAVIAKSFARIHKDNLVNYGILPAIFENHDDYEKIEQEDVLLIENVKQLLKSGKGIVKNLTKQVEIPIYIDLTKRQVELLFEGGLLNYIKKKLERG
ncbi:aconitate hydratase [Pseudothermotoga thermarum]|uniref:Aconitase n=1 Tax=Pseudothermotoga thermarum DSM 5069 TaxID=688269 RepID=F7YV20_9THEM|nr:aconitate hydratase [Pseudothermotoga thermarum]AEH50304.1 aconitase [Pseudothermotoga thermarum DSM 5069]